jgi:hypothetical protein
MFMTLTFDCGHSASFGVNDTSEYRPGVFYRCPVCQKQRAIVRETAVSK